MAIVKDVKPAKAAPAKPIKPIAAPVIGRPNIVQGKPPAQYKYNPGFSASEPKIPALYGSSPFPTPFAPRPLSSLPTTNPWPGVSGRVSVSPYARQAVPPPKSSIFGAPWGGTEAFQQAPESRNIFQRILEGFGVLRGLR